VVTASIERGWVRLLRRFSIAALTFGNIYRPRKA
jgi:hypothetical protein